ncbi:transglutaminase domain-containing protein [Flavobacterium sp.]|uniref:transglutaminase domain-containing protein n=1 Tax=Flavobacterium sp. TaxID=239 RepID=UPI002612C52C|nr:transglutaminase domain-containing protein [Flavobacterium sp.]
MNKWVLLIIILINQFTIEAQISDFKNINFENADKIAYAYKGSDLSNLPQLAYNLTNNQTSDVEKFRAIYTWVSTNIEYDYKSFKKNASKRNEFKNDSLEQSKWNKSFSKQVFKKLVKEKKTLCTGYAYLVKELANLSNINCEIIDGYGRSENLETSELKFPNHSWNAVQLNNKWYLCDATWSSGIYNMNNYTFEFKYNDGYFLTDPELFAKDHFPHESVWSLLNEKTIFSDFLKAPILYGNAYIYGVFPIEPSIMHLEIEKNKEAKFILKDLKNIDINTIFLQIDSGNNNQFIKPKVERLKNGSIEIKYTFSKLGLYDIHVKINNYPICTYVIKVKKELK